jgi:hypothetical protein
MKDLVQLDAKEVMGVVETTDEVEIVLLGNGVVEPVKLLVR